MLPQDERRVVRGVVRVVFHDAIDSTSADERDELNDIVLFELKG